MYKLTLTEDERNAIDWIGHRYAHGNDLYSLLVQCSPENEDWGDSSEIWEISIPEHVAWEIASLKNNDPESWCACFNNELTNKLEALINSIV